jgi:hypothetical protein
MEGLMLTPKKHLDLDVSVLRISALMLRELTKRGVVELERLRAVVAKRTGPSGELVFFPALSFLYLIGRIEYHLKNDTIEYRTD